MNKVFLAGYLARDPDASTSSRTGIPVSRTAIAVNDPARGGGSRLQFVNIVAFDNNAQFINHYLHKGDFVVVEGKINTNRYVNRSGQTAYTTNVVVESVTSNPKNDATSPNFVGGYDDNEGVESIDSESFSENRFNSISNPTSSCLAGGEEEELFKTSTYQIENAHNSSEEVGNSEIT